MRTLVCEICKGSDFVKTDGLYVCGGCGMRYTPAEALKLLAENVSDKTTPHQKKSETDEQLKSYIDLAIQAKQASNYFESESYCDKAIGLDSKNYQARRIKAEVVALQAGGDDDRTNEAIQLYREALDYAPEEFREKLREESGERISHAVVMHAIRVASKYGRTASIVEGKDVCEIPRYVGDCAFRLQYATGIDIQNDKLRMTVTAAMHNGCLEAWNKHIAPTYIQDEHRDKDAMDSYLACGDQAIEILQSALDYFPNDECEKACYQSMIAIQEALIDAHSMQQSGNKWVRKYSLSNEDKRTRRELIDGWRKELERLGVDASRVNVAAQRPAAVDAGKPEKKGIMHRTLTWQGTIGFLCLMRFLILLTESDGRGYPECMIWLFVGILFMAWWYEKG